VPPCALDALHAAETAVSAAGDRVTTTMESSKHGAITLSLMNFSGYVGHVTIFSRILTTACCLVVRLGLGPSVRMRCSVWLVSSYAHY